MRHTPERHIDAADRTVKTIRRKTCKRYSSEDKIRIVLAGLRGEDTIAELCRQEGIAQSQYYSWSKEYMEVGKKRLAGDTAREANTGEVQNLRREARDLKEVVARTAQSNGRHKKPDSPWADVCFRMGVLSIGGSVSRPFPRHCRRY